MGHATAAVRTVAGSCSCAIGGYRGVGRPWSNSEAMAELCAHVPTPQQGKGGSCTCGMGHRAAQHTLHMWHEAQRSTACGDLVRITYPLPSMLQLTGAPTMHADATPAVPRSTSLT